MKNKFIYVCDINEDIDDVVAVEWLFRENLLDCVVLDGKSTNTERIDYLTNLGVRFADDIPSTTKILLCGGAYTKIAKHLETNELDYLIGNGGFCGANIIETPLKKFKGKTFNRTFNFNLDVKAVEDILSSKNVKNILFVSKNVCHSEINVFGGIHKESFLNDYKLSPNKRLHDLLMVKEAVNILKGNPTLCNYENITIENIKSNNGDSFCQWGCNVDKNSNVRISTTFV